MRFRPIVGLSLLVVAVGVATSATAEKRRAAPAPVPAAATTQSEAPSLLSEFRFGFSAQNPWGPDNGSGAVSGEVLFAKPFEPADLFASYFIPRPHVGGCLDFGGQPSFAYAGLTWSFDVAPRVFVEAALSGAVQNDRTKSVRGRLQGPDRRLLAALPRGRRGRLAALAQLERHGSRRAHAERRRLLRQ